MAGINLLPSEKKPKGYAVKASKTLKKIAVLSLIVLFVGLMIYAGSSVFLNIQRRSFISKEDKLKSEIKALQQTEQKLILVEDRLSGIKNILSANNTNDEVQTIGTILSNNPQNVSITGIKLDTQTAVINIAANNSADLTGFFKLLSESNFTQVNLSGFSFDEEKGYKLDIAITN